MSDCKHCEQPITEKQWRTVTWFVHDHSSREQCFLPVTSTYATPKEAS